MAKGKELTEKEKDKIAEKNLKRTVYLAGYMRAVGEKLGFINEVKALDCIEVTEMKLCAPKEFEKGTKDGTKFAEGVSAEGTMGMVNALKRLTEFTEELLLIQQKLDALA